jgi:hypothetical protein
MAIVYFYFGNSWKQFNHLLGKKNSYFNRIDNLFLTFDISLIFYLVYELRSSDKKNQF